MTDKEILAEFKERVNRMPKHDLTKKKDYYSFCERLSKATYPEMIAKDRLIARSMALAGGKLFAWLKIKQEDWTMEEGFWVGCLDELFS